MNNQKLNTVLKIGVIGMGHWGPNLIRNFSQGTHSQVSMLCDRDAERLRAVGTSYPAATLTENYQDVLANPEIQAVVVSTPTATHYDLVREALKAGKHVFVEKPLTTDPASSEALVALANQQARKLMVGHVFLFNRGLRTVKEILDRHELGDLMYLYFIRTNLGPIRVDVNALWDLAPHDISMLLYLLGELPESVSARGSSFINPPIEDVVFANFRFPKGIFANLQVSWLDPKKVRQLVIVGSQKMLIFDDMTPQEPIKIFDKNVSASLSKTAIHDTFQLFRKSIIEGASTTVQVTANEPLKAECEAFVRWVLFNEEQPSTPQLGAEVVHLLDCTTRSMKEEGKSVPCRKGVPISRDVETPAPSLQT